MIENKGCFIAEAAFQFGAGWDLNPVRHNNRLRRAI